MSRKRMALSAWTLAGVCAFGLAHAVETQVHTHRTYEELAKGQLQSTSLTSTGRIFRAPRQQKQAVLGESLILDMEADATGDLYMATGDRGYIYKTIAEDEVTTFAKLAEPLITAITIGDDQALYAAAAPSGIIYRIPLDQTDPDTTPTVFCETGEKYVWSMLTMENGEMLVATGSEGKILKMDREGKATLFLKTDTENVIGLKRFANVGLIAWTQGKGRVYALNLEAPEKSIVLYEAKLEEIKQVVQDRDGALVLAVNGGTNTRKFINDLSAQEKNNGAAPKPAGVDAIVIRLDPEGFAALHWKSPDAPISDMTLHENGRSVLVATGAQGKLYRIEENGDHSIVFGVDEAMIIALAPWNGKLAVGTGDGAALYSMDGANDSPGVYLSTAIDAGSPSQWGAIRWEGACPIDGKVELEVRTGNTEEPDDKLWHPWSEKLDATAGHAIASLPVARYLQYRLTLTDGQRAPTMVEAISAFALPRNMAPILRSVQIENVAAGGQPPKPPENVQNRPAPGQAAAAARMAGEAAGQNTPTGGERVSVKAFTNTGQKKITWNAEDLNGDVLKGSVYFRGIEENRWKLIEMDVSGNSVNFDTKAIPDGRYVVRVVVHDKESNVFGNHLEAERISDILVVDNTEPDILDLEAQVDRNGRHRVRFTVRDAVSFITDVRFSIDAGDWQRLAPVDHLYDSQEERFDFHTDALEQGEHVLTILATDAEGNSAVAKEIIRN